MLTLRSSPLSPFGRKIKIAAHELGLMGRIHIAPADTMDPRDALREQNPLGKIPALVLPDGSSIYDSRVITEYLDMLAGGGRLIPVGLKRFDVLTRQALGDGMMEASILQVYEKRFRSEELRVKAWTDHQAGKVTRALAALEAAVQPLKSPVDAGDISIACALGYLDLRFEGEWRGAHPRLVAWLDAFAAVVPSYDLTRPPAP